MPKDLSWRDVNIPHFSIPSFDTSGSSRQTEALSKSLKDFATDFGKFQARKILSSVTNSATYDEANKAGLISEAVSWDPDIYTYANQRAVQGQAHQNIADDENAYVKANTILDNAANATERGKTATDLLASASKVSEQARLGTEKAIKANNQKQFQEILHEQDSNIAALKAKYGTNPNNPEFFTEATNLVDGLVKDGKITANQASDYLTAIQTQVASTYKDTGAKGFGENQDLANINQAVSGVTQIGLGDETNKLTFVQNYKDKLRKEGKSEEQVEALANKVSTAYDQKVNENVSKHFDPIISNVKLTGSSIQQIRSEIDKQNLSAAQREIVDKKLENKISELNAVVVEKITQISPNIWSDKSIDRTTAIVQACKEAGIEISSYYAARVGDLMESTYGEGLKMQGQVYEYTNLLSEARESFGDLTSKVVQFAKLNPDVAPVDLPAYIKDNLVNTQAGQVAIRQFNAIKEKQKLFHPEESDNQIYQRVITELFNVPYNHRFSEEEVNKYRPYLMILQAMGYVPETFKEPSKISTQSQRNNDVGAILKSSK